MRKLVLFFWTFMINFSISAIALAQHEPSGSTGSSLVPIGAGLAMGLAALGGTLGQGKAAAAALEGIARNPGAASKVQTPMILGLALIESLVLFSFVIAIMLTGKV